MGTAFNPTLRPDALPRETLVDLWRRTSHAHEHLRNTWHGAVADERGVDVADAISLEGWPLLRQGATPAELRDDTKQSNERIGFSSVQCLKHRVDSSIPIAVRSCARHDGRFALVLFVFAIQLRQQRNECGDMIGRRDLLQRIQ